VVIPSENVEKQWSRARTNHDLALIGTQRSKVALATTSHLCDIEDRRPEGQESIENHDVGA